ncbi:MAG: TIGR04282 family arsenosugar biosynthesis glycosyltransferase, partial [Acidobacteriota bacterium]
MNEALVIFARYPRLGCVKTRLNSHLSPQESLRLYQAFLLDTVERTASLRPRRFLYLGDGSRRETAEFARDHHFPADLEMRPQRGGDLGERLWNAYLDLCGRFGRIVFVGTDTPSLPLAYITQAFEKLGQVPIAIGPVEDGGYYLLGVSESRRELFHGVDWGTGSVLQQTLDRLPKQDYVLLPAWHDVDTPADLKRLKRDVDRGFEGFPR